MVCGVKRKLVVLLSFFILTLLFLMNYNAYSQPVNSSRIYGMDRYETAVKISQKGWPDSSRYAVLARGDDFPDALCAGPLARKLNAPILLTETDRLNFVVLDELRRLGVSSVIIAGGTGAVSLDVENELISQGINVERIAGRDRYETSVKIAEKIGTSNRIAITTGSDFPDALSVSAIAANLGMPILLTEKFNLSSSTRQYISERKIDTAYIIGGQGIISDSILETLPGAKRIAGSNRFETNVAVMSEFASEIDFGNIYLAVADGPSGDEFADALSGSVLAAQTKSPVVLVYNRLFSATGRFIKPRMTDSTLITALGGEAVVPVSIIESILDIKRPPVYVNIVDPPISVRPGEIKLVNVVTNPAGAKIEVTSSNTSVVSASISGNVIRVKGVSQGSAVINVTALMQGYSEGSASLVISPFIHNIMKDKYYNTIQAAVDDSAPGDTIKIAPGVYNEHIVISKDNIKLIGADRETTVINAVQDGIKTLPGIAVRDVSGVEIRNLTVMNAGANTARYKATEPCGILLQNSDKNILDNLKLMGNGEYEIYLYNGSDLNTVQNCIIDGLASDNSGYFSLDGIFSSGGEYNKSSVNTGNKFTGNTIRNVVFGISMTACHNTEISNNQINSSDNNFWNGSSSAGVIISNSTSNIVQGNTMKGANYGIRMSILSGISPYAYAGTPDNNTIKDNRISSLQHGIRVMGTGNKVENNQIIGNSEGDGIWLAAMAFSTDVTGNILIGNSIGLLVENASNEAHYNKIIESMVGIKNTTSVSFNAVMNSWGDVYPKILMNGNVDYSPWIGVSADSNSSLPGFQLVSPMVWCTDDNLDEVIGIASSGDTVLLEKNTYILSKQLTAYKDLTISGTSKSDTVLKIDFDTSSDDFGRGAIFIDEGRRLNITNLTVDGSGRKVMDAIHIQGAALISNVRIKNISYNSYNGYGINILGNAEVIVRGTFLSGIEKIGIGVYGNAAVTIGGDEQSDGNTFIGGENVDHSQYGIHVSRQGGNPKAIIENNELNGYEYKNSGLLSSTGILIESGSASMYKNNFSDCLTGIKIREGAFINGTTINSGSAVSVGEDLEINNHFSEGLEPNVIIYRTNSGTPMYPLTQQPSAEQVQPVVE